MNWMTNSVIPEEGRNFLRCICPYRFTVCPTCNKLHLLDLDFSPAAARKFFEEGVKTLEGLFIR